MSSIASRLERRLGVALTIAVVLEVAAVAALVADPSSAGLRDLVGVLVALGALCLGVLAAVRSPVLAWPSLVLAGIAATGIPVRAAAGLESGPAIGWAPVALVVAGCASGSTVIGALYATRPERAPGRAVRWLAWGLSTWLALAAFGTIVLALAGQRDTEQVTPLDVLLLPVRLWLPIVVGLAVLGVVADLRPAVARTQMRVTAGDGVRPGPAGWIATLLDELLGRAEGRRAAAEAERRRLASDLHAEAMPSLRRALRDLDAGRPADEVAAELRGLADELEGVVAERRDPVLEALGLVRALEALAERTEDRGGPTVELVIEEGGADGTYSPSMVSHASPGDAAARPPLAVEAAALRIAGLAIDNATRHGPARQVRLTVAATAARVALAVADDGPGIDPDTEARAVSAGRHGLADMRRLAAEQGAHLSIGAGPGGGTLVRFDWPA